MNPIKSTAICAAVVAAMGFGSMAHAADVPVQNQGPMTYAAGYAAAERTTAPNRGDVATVTPGQTTDKPALRLTLRTPEERFADAPPPVEMMNVHYDQTPNGIPANVSTMGFVRKF